MSWFTRTGASSSKPAARRGEGLWPSNTLYAFEQALALGVDLLEIDIQTTADGVLVVRHDPTVDSTTDGTSLIRDYSLNELKKLDAGHTWTADGGTTFPYRGRGITIPTLEEVFAAFPNARLNIDVKPKEPQVVRRFCELLNDLHKLDQVIVGSFHDNQIALFRRLCPQVLTAAGVAETRRFLLLNNLNLARLYRPPAFAFQVPETVAGGFIPRSLHVVTPRFIRSAHAHGLQVHVWTVNETADMQRLVAWGVDGIMTDYPDRLAAVLTSSRG